MLRFDVADVNGFKAICKSLTRHGLGDNRVYVNTPYGPALVGWAKNFRTSQMCEDFLISSYVARVGIFGRQYKNKVHCNLIDCIELGGRLRHIANCFGLQPETILLYEEGRYLPEEDIIIED